MSEVCTVSGCAKPPRTHGLCHKHYELSLREHNPPCSIEGCDKQSRSKGLCNVHYRQSLLENKPFCRVPNCDRPVISRDLCDVHRKRLKVHGHLDFTRQEDWGARTQHPLYTTWDSIKRFRKYVAEWGDFWIFVRDVGDRPTPNHRLLAKMKAAPLGPDNFRWVECMPNATKSAHQKAWRAKNPRKARSNDLKKTYGITVDDFERMLEEQDGVCAICEQPEKTLNRFTQAPRNLAVDHCHVSGAVRGLLCTNCNTLVGASKDRIDILLKAVQYLERQPSG